MTVSDRLGRPLRDLRISVTDRCNFRCTYCMPKEVYGRGYLFLDRKELLSFEEITRAVGIFTRLGVAKVRLTGGEPLLRRNVDTLVRMIRDLGVRDIALTTNGSLLQPQAQGLRLAGLSRITVSLDSLKDATFSRMNDVAFPVARVIDGIAAAHDAGFTPIKINMVVRRSVNEASILPMARRFARPGFVLRYIEYMDVGRTNGWRLDDVVPAAEILATLSGEFALRPLDPTYRGEVARRYSVEPGGGEIGLITSVSRPFCGDCSRARMTADGQLYTCLFGSRGFDLRDLLRSGGSDQSVVEQIASLWHHRVDRYSELRTGATAVEEKVEMSRIGG